MPAARDVLSSIFDKSESFLSEALDLFHSTVVLTF